MNTEILYNEINDKYGFARAQFQRLLELMDERNVIKNQILFHEGEIVRETYFVISGCLRQYYISPEGNERVIYFSTEGQWAGDLMSKLHGRPTRLNIQALEDSELLVISKSNWELAITTIPDLTLYHIKNQQRILAALKEEVGKANYDSPDEKYLQFMQQYPHLLQRLPLNQIAAYLGITQETLSRVRKRISTKPII